MWWLDIHEKSISPYVGAGCGVSDGQLSEANLQVAGSQLIGKAGYRPLPNNFLGGIRVYVTKKIFLVGEYKYFAAIYKWESEEINTGNPMLNFNFWTQSVSDGIGISF